MFIYSAKMDKKKLAAILVCLAVVAIVVILVLTGGCGDGGSGAVPDSTGPSAGVTDRDLSAQELLRSRQKLIKKARIRTAEDACSLMTELGWSVDPGPAECVEVLIPEEFSDVYTKYNELQKTQGFDLSDYAGKTATRWTVRITNHPSGEEEVYATLLVINAKIIGGDVCASRLDGFMHGLLPSDYVPDAQSSAPSGEPASAADAETAGTSDAEAAETTSAASPSGDETQANSISQDNMLPSN
ncbi:MAG: DUF4830 domain-containing protein [Clostridiales bacterium]|nr:DUF4830 domain-containing protein [Clostridiales bacterium]